MAKRLPTLALDTSAKRRAPTLSKVKFTTQPPPRWLSWPGRASVRFAPSTSTRRRTASFTPGCPSTGRKSTPGGGVPARFAVSSTRRKVIRAVLPISSLMRFGSSTPGSCTTMRLSPWRVICGSSTPVSSMRRRTISIDCTTAAFARSRRAAGGIVRLMSLPSAPTW